MARHDRACALELESADRPHDTGETRARIPMPATQGSRQEPRFDEFGRGASAYESGEEDDIDAPAPRRRAAAMRPARRSASGYTLPSLNLLAAARASERTTLSRDIIDANATALESVLQDFGVRGEIINAGPARWSRFTSSNRRPASSPPA